MKCNNFECSHINVYNGNCEVTGCSKGIYEERVYSNLNSDIITFPTKIGNVTFYTAGQLRSWVIEQQMMNSDRDYGCGRFV